MHNTVLAQIFSTFSRQDRRTLESFVQSPVFNRREDVKRLFHYLCKQIPVGSPPTDKEVLSKRNVFKYVFPIQSNEPAISYDDAALRHTMSFLLKVIKQFLTYEIWTENDLEVGLQLCKALRKRGLQEVYTREYRELEARFQTEQHQSADYFFRQYQLRLEHLELSQRSERGITNNLEEVGDAFAAFVATNILRQACAMLSKPNDQNSVQKLSYLAETLAATERGDFDHVPAVSVYFRCYKMLSADHPGEHFFALRLLLEQHWKLFPQHETRDIYVAAINFCIRQLNTGARNYIREALELYRSGLERKIIFEDGFLSKYTYNNILLLAIAEEEWDWSLQFLETYRDSLPKSDRDSAYRYNLATYYFRKKDYPQAQNILRNVEFRDAFYNLDSRRMLVRIYFEEGEVSALDSLLDSFAIYLRRKSSSLGYHKDLNMNFVRFVKNIIRLEPGDETTRTKLQEKMLTTKYVAERSWLLEKL